MDRLFNINLHLHSYMEDLRKNINIKINSMDENEILSSNETECIQYLFDLFKIKPLELYCEEIAFSKESRVFYAKDLPRKISSNPYKEVEVPNIIFSIPFKGDKELLKYTPSHYQLPSKKFYIKNNCICFDILKLDDNPISIKNDVENSKKFLIRMFENMNKDLIKYNKELKIYIENSFRNKKKTIINENDFFASLDIPQVNPKKIQKKGTYSVPINYHDKISIDTKEISDLEPTLDYSSYKKLLTSIYNYCSNFEQHPEICRGRNEESIRDLILTLLSSNVDETVTGEAINGEGKTDILIKHGFYNLFVAECKIWHGKKEYLKAITQLLSYLTWKDSKTALIIFVRGQQIPHVLEEVNNHTKSHENYKKFVCCHKENWFEYEFINEDIDLYLSVLVFKIY